MPNVTVIRAACGVALACGFYSPGRVQAAQLFVDAQISSASCANYEPASRACGSGQERAYKTLAGVNAVVLAGDVILIRAGTYADRISPARSGTAAQPIVYRRFGSEQVVITGLPGVSLSSRSYVTIDGITIRVSGCGGICYVFLDNSHHITIQNSRMDQSLNQSGWPEGINIDNNSHHNKLLNNIIGKVGYYTSDDIGSLMEIGSHNPADKSDYNLIEGNTFFHGGHDLLAIAGNYNIIRNNYFHNEEWSSCARMQTGGLCGNRLVVVDGPSSNSRYNVLEGNTFAFSGLPPDNDGSSGVGLRTGYTIVRRNVFYENDQAGLNIATLGYTANFPPPLDLRFNHVFHNVFFHNAFAAITPGFKPFEAAITLTDFGGPPITEVTIKNNIMWQNRWAQAISYYHVDPALQTEGVNWKEAGDPLFVNDRAAPDPLDQSRLDFHLQPTSPAVDAGASLTRTTAGGSGTQIPVEDAMFFIDGFGVVLGDLVQLEGQTRTVRVVAVDYGLNRITIDAPLTWQQGQGVSLAYSGAAPDLGAFESGPRSTVPAPPTNVRIVR